MYAMTADAPRLYYHAVAPDPDSHRAAGGLGSPGYLQPTDVGHHSLGRRAFAQVAMRYIRFEAWCGVAVSTIICCVAPFPRRRGVCPSRYALHPVESPPPTGHAAVSQ